jgi:hypothetical protein
MINPSDAGPPEATLELVDLEGVADRLGVKHQTARQWRTRGVLPEPDFPLASPTWMWSTIRAWAIESGRL